MKFPRASLILLVLQVAIVSSIAAKYLYQRLTCPRVWTRAVAYDPSMVMRGRYLSARLHIDICGIPLHPVANDHRGYPTDDFAHFDLENGGGFQTEVPVLVGADRGRLVALKLAGSGDEHASEYLDIRRDAPCSEAALQKPVDFYVSDTAKTPFPLPIGSELWVEVTVPTKGPPRPIALALKSADGRWQPLEYH